MSLTLSHKLSVLLLMLLLLPAAARPETITKADIRIGVLAVWGKAQTRKMWQPTIDYLNQHIHTHHFRLVPLRLNDTTHAVAQKKIDFIITNPGNYIVLEAQYGVSRLATLKSKKQHHTSNQFAAVIFTRADNDDINNLRDLKNKSFIAVNKHAFGGFQMAWRELLQHGIDPFDDFSSLQFAGLPQKNIVFAVLNRQADAGTVRTSILETLESTGKIRLDDIKILNRKQHKGFPYLHSTAMYPEWPVAKLHNTSEQLAKQLTVTLLQLPADSHAASMINSSGWTVPLDYNPVRQLFRELNLPPYNIEIRGFFQRYWLESALFLLLVLQPAFLYILKLRKTVREDEEKLADVEIEWADALDFLDEPMYMVDLNDRIIRANKAFYKSRNTTAEEAIGRLVTDFSHPDGEPVPCKVCDARRALKDTIIILEPDDPVNPAGRPLEISIKVIHNRDHQPVGIIQRMRDLTAERQAEKNLRRSKTLFKELLNATPEPLIVSNIDGTIVLVNTQFEKEFGYRREEIIGFKVEKLIPAQYRTHHAELRRDYSAHPYVRPMGEGRQLVGLHKDGHEIPVDISLSPFEIDDERLIISTLHNITGRLKKEKELRRLASFPEFNPIPIIEFKKDCTVTYANPAARELFPSITENNVKHEIFVGLEDDVATLQQSHELIRDIQLSDSTFEQKIIYNPETELFRMYIWDITRLRNLTQKMTYQATHDMLTSLINRREFERRLKIANDEARHNNKVHSVCYMDLDQFKVVNDSCGHAAGDELLKQLSTAISNKVRDSDTLARLGGDEFGLLLIGCPVEKAEYIAEEIRQTVEDFRFHWDQKTFKVGISIGIVTIDKTTGTIKDIQSAADTACYMAKQQGRNRVHVYKTDSSLISQYNNESNWLNRIHHALDNDELVLYFQRIQAINKTQQDHYEVLVRMKDASGKIIPPSAFIPAAERFDIMSSVDSHVVKKTLAVMQQADYQGIDFSVNLSGQSLGHLKFMQSCIKQIIDSKIDPARLCFEITETAMIANISDAISSVSKLRELGCKVALDDFGSGLSSFAYLKNLPVDFLKIDGSLIKDLEHDKVNVTMVKSIIYIGHSMGLYTIAEYVENDAILQILRDLHIDYVQGYGIACPVPLEELTVE